MINKIEFSARNLTSNAGLFLLLGHAGNNGIFDLIDPEIVFATDKAGRKTAELVTTLKAWKTERRFVVSWILKEEQGSAQLSCLDGEEYEYAFFVTKTDLSPEEVVDFYQKQKYIKKAKYDMAVGRLLLKS